MHKKTRNGELVDVSVRENPWTTSASQTICAFSVREELNSRVN